MVQKVLKSFRGSLLLLLGCWLGKKRINAGLIRPALSVVISAVISLRPYQVLLSVNSLGNMAVATYLRAASSAESSLTS